MLIFLLSVVISTVTFARPCETYNNRNFCENDNKCEWFNDVCRAMPVGPTPTPIRTPTPPRTPTPHTKLCNSYGNQNSCDQDSNGVCEWLNEVCIKRTDAPPASACSCRITWSKGGSPLKLIQNVGNFKTNVQCETKCETELNSAYQNEIFPNLISYCPDKSDQTAKFEYMLKNGWTKTSSSGLGYFYCKSEMTCPNGCFFAKFENKTPSCVKTINCKLPGINNQSSQFNAAKSTGWYSWDGTVYEGCGLPVTKYSPSFKK